MKKGFLVISYSGLLWACQPDESGLVSNQEVYASLDASQVTTETITGFAWMHSLPPGHGDTLVQELHFEPEARHFWHDHSQVELLIATTGTGYYQEEGQPIQLVQVGDTIRVNPRVVHWHGATAASRFSYKVIRLKTDTVTWRSPVVDSQYDGYH